MNTDLTRTIDVFLSDTPKPLIVILGPTASGKTSLSIQVAKHVGGEVINADSRQLYKYLDIGTAKITEEEMDGVPHHLIDVFDPKEEVTVGWFQSETTKVIDEVISRGKVPLLVGGSMLYVSSITDSLSLAPVADSALHQKLMDEYDKDGGASLYKRLMKIDPDAASNIHQNNKPRVVRAVEIYEILKLPKSKAISAKGELRPRDDVSRLGCTLLERGVWSEAENDESRDSATSLEKSNLLIFGVEQSGGNLKRRISERLEQMFADGWIEEVRDLLAKGYSAEDPGMKSHGYREIIHYLDELDQVSSDADIDVMKEDLKKRIAAKTRQYAKRQMTWWRNDKRIRWVVV